MSPSVCCKYLLHDLVQEVVAEMSHGDGSRFSDQVLCHIEEASTLEIAEDKVTFKNSDNEQELNDQRDEVS